MGREELMEFLRPGPALIRMNDGREYLVDNLERVTVSSMAARVFRLWTTASCEPSYGLWRR